MSKALDAASGRSHSLLRESPPKPTKYRAIAQVARNQRRRDRQRRLRAGEQLSDEEDEQEKGGMGLKMLEIMKVGSNSDELIASFKKALDAPRPELDLEGGIYVAPKEGSTEVYWEPPEVELEQEMERSEAKHAEKKRERRDKALKHLQNAARMRNEEVSTSGSQGDGRGGSRGGSRDSELILEHIGMQDHDALSICSDIAKCSHITLLSLALNSLGPQGCVALSEALPSLTALTHLSLGYNKLGNDGCSIVAEAARGIPGLRKLLLPCNNIGPSLPWELLALTQLRTLSLRGNAIEAVPRGVFAMFVELDLDDNSPVLAECLMDELEEEHALAMVRRLRKLGTHNMQTAWKRWEELDVRAGRYAYTVAAKHFTDAGALEEMSAQLDELKLALDKREEALGMGFVRKQGDETQIMISESVERAIKALEIDQEGLSVAHQMVGDLGVTNICKRIEAKGSSLVWLDMSNCDVGPQGAKELAMRFVAKTHSLKTLWLGRNRLGDEGATNLAMGLQHNTSLAKLDIEHNKVGGEGIKMIVQALKANPSFRALCASMNWVGDTGGLEIAQALKHMRNLQEIDVSGSGVMSKGSAALSEEFKNHQGIIYGKMWR